MIGKLRGADWSLLLFSTICYQSTMARPLWVRSADELCKMCDNARNSVQQRQIRGNLQAGSVPNQHQRDGNHQAVGNYLFCRIVVWKKGTEWQIFCHQGNACGSASTACTVSSSVRKKRLQVAVLTSLLAFILCMSWRVSLWGSSDQEPCKRCRNCGHNLWLNHAVQMFPAVKEFKRFQWHSRSPKYLSRKAPRHTGLKHLPHASFSPTNFTIQPLGDPP